MRVTQQLMVNRVLGNLNKQTGKLLALQEQLATGLKVNTPSDDPLAARRAVNIRANIGAIEQYITNLSTAGPFLTESTNALQTVVDVLQRAQVLTVQGATGTNNQTQLDQIAIEIDQLLETAVAEANHQTNGRYLFGGTRTTSPPFAVTRDAENRITAVTYQGNDEAIRIAIGDSVDVAINETGSDAFQSAQDIFQMLIAIRDNLRAGDQASLQNQRLAELPTARGQLLISLARIGAVQNRIEQATANAENVVQQLRSALSDSIDADYAETVVNLNAQSNAYQAALNAAARVIQPSLLDFVR
ncbi:MAG TPA: flagellar hook-associated protein FlgL [Candidatus Hydrogenedentes bacterium]|nr:flagellar hook-associated protein FlgL [Candidatus Hydrogenedentota bacterium]HOT49671.1 flagellar hook-associated protein FlgL [Candidatus Hydrogenedentota bacterium]HOV72958.1 flagellar hook-associated protein FlgL [Candidatus Hydrogenedentota bacterium]HPC15804.1 flagellar hook-associated protein FlgL [Candidatus Hydrogenedentota bacterium]HRT19787.1 flagellar hook-associated protein FlgL [Candidatus Hydrogenedentota bacterium]